MHLSCVRFKTAALLSPLAGIVIPAVSGIRRGLHSGCVRNSAAMVLLGILLGGGAGNKALAASCLDGVSVFGDSQIELRDRVEIASGTAFSNGTNGSGIVIGNDAKTRDLKSGSDIILGDRSTALGSATAGGTVTLNSGASVSGEIHEGVNVPLCEIPEEPGFQTGSESHDVWNSNTLELSPGEYDEVQVFSNSTLKLESGTYSFSLLRFEADAILELDADNGTVEILVENSLSFGDRTLFEFSGGIQAPSRVKFYSGQTSTVYVGTDVNFYGTLVAPLAQVKAFSRTVFRGAVHGKSIDYEPDVVVNYVPLVAPGLDLPDIYPPTYIPGHTSYLEACVLALESSSLPEGTQWVPACSTAIRQNEFRIQVTEQIPGRDLGSNPPKIADMTVFPLNPTTSEGNAVMEVVYDEPMPEAVNFVWDAEVKTLRDDGNAPDNVPGDGIYTVVLEVDFGSLPAPEEGEEGIPVPIFGREIVRQASLSTGEVDLSAKSIPEPLLKTCGPVVDHDPTNPDCPLHPEKVFMIRELGVVNDPERTSDPCLDVAEGQDISGPATKKWTFGYLMSQMVSQEHIAEKLTELGTDDTEEALQHASSEFALNWLDKWHETTTVNGQELPNLGEFIFGGVETSLPKRLKDMWLEASNQAGAANGEVLMKLAPFRLLAIVNRFDLRRNNSTTGRLAGGELRFVFTPVVPYLGGPHEGPCLVHGFENTSDPVHTVILEYAVDLDLGADTLAVSKWAQAWKDLNQWPLGIPKAYNEYLKALEAITEQVVRAGRGEIVAQRPNGSALRQIRTNETVREIEWDLREFVIDEAAHAPVPATVKKAPADNLNETAILGRWLSDSVLVYSDDQSPVPHIPDSVPAGYPPHPVMEAPFPYFEGARTINTTPTNDKKEGTIPGFWQPAPGFLDYADTNHRKARHRFSLNACSACHGTETRDPINDSPQAFPFFAHVMPRRYEDVALLSNFLTGLPADPVLAQYPDEPVYVPDPVVTTIPGVSVLNSVAWTGSEYIIVGGDFSFGGSGSVILTSPDGYNFTVPQVEEGLSGKSLNSVVWTGNSLVAVGQDGAVAFSHTGALWSSVETSETDDLLSVISTGNGLMAVGENGTILTSPTGTNWTTIAPPSSGTMDTYKDVTWTGERFIVVGEGEKGAVQVVINASGTVGNSGEIFAVKSFESVTWTGSRVVAVGTDGAVYTSADGVGGWLPRSSVTTNKLTSVTWTGNDLVAVGDGGAVVTSSSPNGLSWQLGESRTHFYLNSVIWTGSELVVTGPNGLFFTDPGPGVPDWVLGDTGKRFRYFEDLHFRYEDLKTFLEQASPEGKAPTMMTYQPTGRVH